MLLLGHENEDSAQGWRVQKWVGQGSTFDVVGG